ncbi:hypothetical protein SEA_BRICOLE_63 [Mycobacterium phage Bricole]|uniref:Uncharacterized protein n=2 Tax=Bongovirus bongo TaxID=1983750 RepID=A0A0M3UKD5_9CAUD|nr:hypothetical protein PEGLEG_63 [Mycobacterium phage PegLeg]AGM12314.1 hypothetical protein PEGLEG_63 [Mycobacterium phage PegLeg]ALF00591.1 hypothetical protein SEA_BRICOLE_63 [Mycobacterium phage Bricole]
MIIYFAHAKSESGDDYYFVGKSEAEVNMQILDMARMVWGDDNPEFVPDPEYGIHTYDDWLMDGFGVHMEKFEL